MVRGALRLGLSYRPSLLQKIPGWGMPYETEIHDWQVSQETFNLAVHVLEAPDSQACSESNSAAIFA